MLRVFTTGQVAKVFNVNINTAIKWFDEGKLTGFRLPRSRERRIYRESLLAFMQRHEISMELLERFEETRAARLKSRSRGAEQRGFPRQVVHRLQGHLSLEGLEISAPLRDLSVGGASLSGLSSPNKLIPEEFDLTISDATGAALLNTRCQLMHLRREADQGFTLGCRFLQIDPSRLQQICLTAN